VAHDGVTRRATRISPKTDDAAMAETTGCSEPRSFATKGAGRALELRIYRPICVLIIGPTRTGQSRFQLNDGSVTAP